ncbi:NAD(P)-dependent oxidoreductase [Desulfoplanes formicivorans]|uniref:6-phosphogluconate dehydrogenase NAD-binding protein n=1 Tax=Desulfoplanes formicivorans TaxID=1592317 RepID=A0A194AH89_9BACT|nr:NAD(P)-dependent oxidoreductase [Desulfoplanes formicivorans]GAU08580.1 6-phosphogluconate dehydrogenase NAD-binding protein [Desulfoplanes formicivorans]
MNKERIGWIGTGVMGEPMCAHLMEAGYPMRVYNRTREKAATLIARGAVWCDSPAELACECDMVFSIVGFPEDVAGVILGENGVLSTLPQGGIIVDMTTSRPSLAKAIYDEAAQRNIAALDAPVSGGDLGARQGTLAIMVGGDQAAFDRVLPLLHIMGKTIALMGGPGCGQHTKMTNQILIAGTMIGVVESLLYAQKAGMNMDEVIDIIGSGAASSWSINNLGRRIAKQDFEPGFFIKHFIKDMGIALDECQAMNINLPGLSLVHDFYKTAADQGMEHKGTQALFKVLEAMQNR